LIIARSSWDVALVGQYLDDRGKAAIDFIAQHCDRVMTLEYDPDNFTLAVNGIVYEAERLDEYFKSHRPKDVVLETTTLGFVETFLCCRVLHDLSFLGVTCVYVEPVQYRVQQDKIRRSRLLHKRDFDLSNEVPGYKPIPGATVMLREDQLQRNVFFIGYEERRLDRALEDHQMIHPSTCSLVFGVPAFQPGWEMDAFANNIRVIKERNIRGGVYFCAAESPLGAVEVLNQIKSELQRGERLIIGPIGTKPHGVGAALFACVNENVGMLYDHPTRSPGRTSQVAKWHLYNVEFN
jgi:hypothetical protein